MTSVFKKIFRNLLLTFLVVPTLLLVSCLDLDTDIRLKKDGSVDTVLIYNLSAETVDFGRGFGSDEPWPLPLTEKDFQQQALRVPGVELKRYTVRSNSDGSENIQIKIKADSLESLSEYLNLDITLQGGSESGSLLFNIPAADDYLNGDPDIREALDAIIGDSLFRFSFTPPSKPENSEPGTISGKTAFLEIPFSDILHRRAPQTWVVDW